MNTPLRLFTLLSLLLGLCSAVHATQSDTLAVPSALLDGPHRLHRPFRTDSLTLGKKAFDPTEVMRYNRGRAQLPPSSHCTSITTGTPLTPDAFHILHFTVDAERWTKVKLDAPRMNRFDTFINGTSGQAGELRLRPGRTRISLILYGDSTARDTFRLALIGTNARYLRVNEAAPRKYSLDDMTFGERFYGMRLSPSGRYLLTYYNNTRLNGETTYRTVLTDLTQNRILFRREGYEHVSWMPRRDALYFTRQTDSGRQFLTIDPATMTERTLATGLPDGHLTLSPDERFLVISVSDEGPQAGALKLLFTPDDRMPNWRSRSSLFLYDIASGTTQRLTYGKESMHLTDIATDGSRLLLMRTVMSPTQSPFDRSDVFEYHLTTGRMDTLLTAQPWLRHAQYSPDARQILFTATPAAFDGIGSEVLPGQQPQGFDVRLFLYDLATRKATPLLPGFCPSVDHAEWHHADGMIYMACTDGYDRTLWRLNPKTRERIRYQLPTTLVQGFSIADTRHPRLAFYGQTGTTARDGYLTRLTERSTPKCIPFGEVSFQKAHGEVRTASCTPWQFTTTRQDTIQGFYYLPADFDATKHYPMLVYYYGGCVPTTRQLEFHYPLSVLANMGYVVLTLEPSGATGFGQEFAARHVNTWGQMSANDIIEGTKAFCAAHPFVNAKKIGCMGASYGGFMTQYLQTRTDIFAAAVSHAGISNIASYWGGGYWGYTYGETANYGSFPWNNPRLFTEQSPLFQADKIHTPLLLLHGTSDTNVPTNESQQLFTALRILGREVSYIQVDGEDHVIGDFHKRRQWQDAIMAWFAKHLQDDGTWWKDLGYE